MQLDIRNHGLKLTRASRRHIDRKVRHALRAFADELQGVTLLVIREARPGRNVRYRCEVVVRPKERVPLHAVEWDATIYDVCAKAINTAGLTLLRALTPRSETSRVLLPSI